VDTVAGKLGQAVAGGIASVFNNIGYYAIGKIAFGISYLIAAIGGIAIAIEAWLVGVMLGINRDIFQTVIVQKGFGVTLSIANLGFVLGIIVMAVATILHSETYGYKKILWKLVIAAILVNFSLVIMAPVFNLGNSFTQYFLNCIDPSVGCNAPAGASALTSMNDFAKNLAGAFNPQDGLAFASSTALSNPNSNFASLGGSFSQMIVPIFSVAFVALETIFIAIVLAVLSFMLLVRYLYITFLAILMPFAWLGWVFPSIKGWWSKWWEHFIRWTFFAPIVVFFLWLAIITTQAMSNGQAVASQQFATYTSNSNVVWAAVSSLFTSLFTRIIQNVLNIIVMLGLTVGGLMVADRMSITGAKAGIGAAKSVGKAVGGYAAKQSQKTGRWAFRKTGGEKVVAGMRKGNFGSLKGVPVVGGVADKVYQNATAPVKRLASIAGRAVDEHLTNKALVEAAKKKVSDSPAKIKENLAGSMNTEDRLAHISKLIEKGELTDDVMVGDQLVKDYLDKNSDIIKENYDSGKILGDSSKMLGSNKEVRDAERKFDQLREGGKDTTQALADLETETRKFAQSLSKSDTAKMNVNGMFKENNVASRARLAIFAKYNPALLPGMFAKAKGSVGENMRAGFDEIYKKREQELGSWQNDPEFVQRDTEIEQELKDLDARLISVQNDPAMNAGEKGKAASEINNDIKKLRKEKGNMQKDYIDKNLNAEFHKDIIEKAMMNNVLNQPQSEPTPAAPAPAAGGH